MAIMKMSLENICRIPRDAAHFVGGCQANRINLFSFLTQGRFLAPCGNVSSLFRQIDEGKRIKFLNTLVFMKSPKALSAAPPPLGPYAPSPRLRTSK